MFLYLCLRSASLGFVFIVFSLGSGFAQTPPAPPNGNLEIYVVENGGRGGPYTREQLIEKARRGQVTGQSLVWMNGMADWTEAAAVPGIAELLTQTVPPPPPPERNYNEFLAGTWIGDPTQIPMEGVGLADVQAQFSFTEQGSFTAKIVRTVMTGFGVPLTIKEDTQGTYKLTQAGPEGFTIGYNGTTISTSGYDGSTSTSPFSGQFPIKVIDENTITDGAKSIYRRQRY